MIGILAAAAVAAKPIYVFNVNDSSAAVVDQRTIQSLPGNLKKFELNAIFAKRAPYRGDWMQTSVTPYTIDCNEARYYYGATTYRTLAGKTLVVDKAEDQSGKWKSFPFGSRLLPLRAWVCEGILSPGWATPVDDMKEATSFYLNKIEKPDAAASR